MKYKLRKKRRKIISTYQFLIIIIVILVTVGVGYSYWSDTLTVNMVATANFREAQLECEPVRPSGSSNRYTTNTKLTGGLIGATFFSVASDTYESNQVTTNVKKESTALLSGNITVTFTLTILNNSKTTFKNGNINSEEYDPNNQMQVTSQTLSKTTVEPGSTSVITVKVSMTNSIWGSISNGSYVRFKITYEEDGIPKYFYYTIKIVN